MTSAAALDPITLEVLVQALIATVREMRATVCRTASSVAIYDARDFSCGLFAPDGQVIAQSEDIGSHVVPLPWSVRAAIEKMGASLAAGEAVRGQRVGRTMKRRANRGEIFLAIL